MLVEELLEARRVLEGRVHAHADRRRSGVRRVAEEQGGHAGGVVEVAVHLACRVPLLTHPLAGRIVPVDELKGLEVFLHVGAHHLIVLTQHVRVAAQVVIHTRREVDHVTRLGQGDAVHGGHAVGEKVERCRVHARRARDVDGLEGGENIRELHLEGTLVLREGRTHCRADAVAAEDVVIVHITLNSVLAADEHALVGAVHVLHLGVVARLKGLVVDKMLMEVPRDGGGDEVSVDDVILANVVRI
mmetsp:Transcript_20649/g.55750  ORF Transcript_20649/g.55750 Transcript_20649/m.55750 type:complete len:245 (-) Transcript_20649:459-1193(-)